jgi:hypothetical protein
MIIETAMILALGTAVPSCDGTLFRRQGAVICIERRTTRGNEETIPRRSNRPVYERNRNVEYTKVRKPIPLVRTLLGIRRYERRSKRTIIRGVSHILQSRDRGAELARRRAIQKAYSDKRKQR